MKKFLIFLVSIIVVICLGMTFYYFAKDEEVIKFKTSTIYINAGESITLEDLGFSHTGKKKETKINFNAGDDSVKSIISYNSALGRYVSTAKGGNTTIVITTNNYKFRRFEIKVTVGNGTKETPYQIYTEDDLFAIGGTKFDTTPDNSVNEGLSSYYVLMNDITLTKPHLPIGNTLNACDSFEGNFNGNYYSIYNLQNEANDYGGLFALIGSNAEVTNLNIKNATISGDFEYAGVLAGVINGYVDRVQILNCSVDNTKDGSKTGALAGKIETSMAGNNPKDITATVYRVAIESDDQHSIKGMTYVGGIAGQIINTNLDGIKVATNISSSSLQYSIGGFAGEITLDIYNFVRESYSLSSISTNSSYGKKGALFGIIDASLGIDTKTSLMGLYYNKEQIGCDSCYAESNTVFESLDSSGTQSAKLKSNSTYILRYDESGSPISWRTSVWKLIDGQYPVLKYLESAIPDNIEIDSDNKPSNPTTPVDPIDPIDPITPDVPTDLIEISTSDDLLSITSFEPNKTYKIKANLDLNGSNWTAKKLNQAKFVADSPVTISNFNVYSATNYCGFFSSIVNGTIENITFANVTINNTTLSYQYIGIVAGVVNGATINNVHVTNSTISNSNQNSIVDYAGGLIGVCTNSSASIADCSANATIDGHIKNVGGFVGMTGLNTKIEHSSFGGSVSSLRYLGGFVAENNGFIDNCTANAQISINQSTEQNSYVGGFAGPNFNSITNSKVYLDNILVNNTSAQHTIYVGGFVAYSGPSNSVCDCSVLGKNTSSTIKILNNLGNIQIGGIISFNKGILKNSTNELSTIGAELNGVYVGGIVCQNDNGSIDSCMSLSDLYGDKVGGLAYNITGNSIISKSAIGYANQRVTLKGNELAGISCYVACGNISDCLILTTTYGLTNDSILTGGVLSFPLSTDGKYGVIERCVISNVFAGYGKTYLVTPAGIFSATRTTGTLKNCVVDMTCNGTSNATEPSYDKNWLYQVQPSASGSNYTKADSSSLYSISTYSNSNFKIATDKSSVWYYISAGNSLPRLVALEK